ncbi:hypothetical protein [Prauserella muralis]|uniref:Uncharacterized protein n=1 Tax=Prauserella muralis TaxID=588067 RepID=A0A2V4B016_9PSEU|nr:hypothetical protein [Prauserella muralis]PXY27482.1 hypothetical protein BAY60_13765 [Prauserella muralis]TWE22806.1 hypothetical protein FHX69_4057 [Prauserella muralis]
MSTGAIVTIVVLAVVLVVLLALVAWQHRRRTHLRERFGPEYDRAVEDTGSRRHAERELARREAEHEGLEIRPLTAESRERYRQSWELVQQQFVDRPAEAVVDADRLLTALLAERGYPTGDHEEQAAALSVTHARTLQDYRAAHDVVRRHGNGQASTEDLREAMVRYRGIVDELLREEPEHAGPRHRKS